MNALLLFTSLLLAQAQPDEGDPPETETAASADETADNAAAEGDDDTPADGQPSDSPEGGMDDAGSPIMGTLRDITNSGALGLLIKGGWFMAPILVMAIIAAGVIIERYRSLKMLSTDSGELRREVHGLLLADQVEDALQLCDREQGPVPAILGAGLRKYFVLRRLNYDVDRIREQVVKAMDDYNVHVVAALERHLPILATIASVAPMLGFLGTVAGMIVSFDNIDTNFGNENIVKLAAGGIKVSLLTTAFGLMVGIPAFMAFNYFTSVIDRFVLDVEESATDLIEAVTLQTAMDQQPPVESEANIG
jgi:biopolymer transport protein ExbB